MKDSLETKIDTELKRSSLISKILGTIGEYPKELSFALMDMLERYSENQDNINAALVYRGRLPIIRGRGGPFVRFLGNQTYVREEISDVLTSKTATIEVDYRTASLTFQTKKGEMIQNVEMPELYAYSRFLYQDFFHRGSVAISIKRCKKMGKVGFRREYQYGKEFEDVPLLHLFFQNQHYAFDFDGNPITMITSAKRLKRKVLDDINIAEENQRLFDPAKARQEIISDLIRKWADSETDFSREGLTYMLQGDFMRTCNPNGYVSFGDEEAIFYVDRRYAGKNVTLRLRGLHAIVESKSKKKLNSRTYKCYVSYKRNPYYGTNPESITLKERNFMVKKTGIRENPFYYQIYTSSLSRELEGHERAAFLIHRTPQDQIQISLLVLRDGEVSQYDITERMYKTGR